MAEPPGGGDSGSSATGRSRLVAAGILASRLLGLVREMLVASLAGVGLAADVLQVVFRGPNFLQNLLGEQALSASFIPVYSRMLEEGREREARRFAGAAFGLLTLVAASLAVTVALVAPLWVTVFAPGLRGKPEAFDLAVTATRILLPMTAILVVSAWCLAVLNSHRRFFLPYFAPVLWNLSIITALGALASRTEEPIARTVVLTMAVAALIGAVLQLAVQIPPALRMNGGLDPRPALDAPGVRPAVRTFVPALLGRGSVQLSGWLDVALASLLAEGAMAALGYAQKLYLLPVALFGTAMAVVELPEVSRLGSQRGERDSLARLRAALDQVAFLTVPAAIGFLALGWLVVAVIYRRGRFGAEGTWLVYGVLGVYALGLIASTSSRLVQNLFYAGSDTMTPAKRGLLRVLVQGAVGGSLMLWLERYTVAGLVTGAESGSGLRLGAVGLAIGSAVAAWVELASLRLALRRRLDDETSVPGVPWRRLVVFGSIACGSAGVAAAVWLALAGLPVLLQAAAVLPTYVVVYLAIASLSGLPEARRFFGRVRSLA